MWVLHTYQEENGNCPFLTWKESLDLKTQTRIDVRLDRLKLGLFGDCKSISQGVYELRFHFGSGYRIYFGKSGQKIILLLTGGDKKTQKKDIQKAIAFWEIYKETNQ